MSATGVNDVAPATQPLPATRVSLLVDFVDGAAVSVMRSWASDGSMSSVSLDQDDLRLALRAIADMLDEKAKAKAAEAAKAAKR